MDNVAGPGCQSPVRRFSIDVLSNKENTLSPLTVSRLRNLLERMDNAALNIEKPVVATSPKKAEADGKEVTVKLQGGATIKLCSTCARNNKIEEKLQPKRRRSVANDEGETKKSKPTTKKQPPTSGAIPAPKEKTTRAKKVTEEKVPKPRNTRKKAAGDENNGLVDGNIDSLSMNEAKTESENAQSTQTEEIDDKKNKKPRAVKTKGTTKKTTQTKESQTVNSTGEGITDDKVKPKKPKQIKSKKNASEENVELAFENMNITDLLNSISENNKKGNSDLHDNNTENSKKENDLYLKDNDNQLANKSNNRKHGTQTNSKRTEEKQSTDVFVGNKNKTRAVKELKQEDFKENTPHEKIEKVFKDTALTDLANAINEEFEIDEVKNSTLKENCCDSLFSNEDTHMENSLSNSADKIVKSRTGKKTHYESKKLQRSTETSIQQTKNNTNITKERIILLNSRMTTRNISRQQTEFDDVNVTELFAAVCEENKIDEENVGELQNINFDSLLSDENAESQVDNLPSNQTTKNQGAIKKHAPKKGHNKTKEKQVEESHVKTINSKKQTVTDTKHTTLAESKPKKNISHENIEPEFHAEHSNNVHIKSEPVHDHNISNSSKLDDCNINSSTKHEEYNIDDSCKKKLGSKENFLKCQYQVREPESPYKQSKSQKKKSPECRKTSKSKDQLLNTTTKGTLTKLQEKNTKESKKVMESKSRRSEKQFKKQKKLAKTVEEMSKYFGNVHIENIQQLYIGSQLADYDSDSSSYTSSECSSSCSCKRDSSSGSSCKCWTCAL